MVPWVGIEPTTYPLGGDRSIHWATRAVAAPPKKRSALLKTRSKSSFTIFSKLRFFARFRLASHLFMRICKISYVVPRAGLEPAQCHHHLILSQARLPIPPSRHILFFRDPKEWRSIPEP